LLLDYADEKYIAMRSIKEFLDRFKNLKPSNKIIEERAQDIIEELLNIPSSYYEVVFKKPNLIIVSCGSVLKNEIFTKKEEIIKKLEDEFGRSAPSKISFK
jgi:hypothetical protein